jgi:hypothetical protein
VPQPTNEPNVRILPDPELNPLLNPLLATHMGRWAEVYFTTPPEKRAEAVSELVRELANNPTPAKIAARPMTEERMHETPHERVDETVVDETVDEAFEDLPEQAATSELPLEPATVLCGNCGQRNSAPQRFCGMCGARLVLAPESDRQQIAEAAPAALRWDAPEQILASEPSASDSDSAPRFLYHREDFFASERPSPTPAAERPTEFASLSQYQPAPRSRSYRGYAGAAVAIILAVLVYATWRGNTAFWSSGSVPAGLPQAVPTPSPESGPGTASKPAETATTQPSSTNNPGPASPSAASGHEKQTSESTESNHEVKASPAPRIVPVSVSSSAATAAQSGSEELATAEKYLNASPGKARDSQQAASWLWKAVAKKNLTATLLLSDLYLQGDGVTKSCDQARLLLDAAARKGGTAAAERLRNLPAFGCR